MNVGFKNHVIASFTASQPRAYSIRIIYVGIHAERSMLRKALNQPYRIAKKPYNPEFYVSLIAVFTFTENLLCLFRVMKTIDA